MKLFVIILLVFFLNACSHQQKKENEQPVHNFRKSQWGDSMDKVMRTENRKPWKIKTDEILYDSIPLGKYQMDLTYAFSDGKLFLANYIFSAGKHVSNLDVMLAQTELEKTLTSKYGKYTVDELEPEKKVWQDGLTEIVLTPFTDDSGEKSVFIEYSSIKIRRENVDKLKAEDSLNRQKMSNDL